MRLRLTAEQEEIDGVHPDNIYEMGLSVSCIDESVYSTSKVLVSVTMSASLRNNGETHLHLPSAEDRQKHDPSDKNMCGTQDAFREKNTAPNCSTVQIKV